MHSVPADPGWTASPICSSLICGRHNAAGIAKRAAGSTSGSPIRERKHRRRWLTKSCRGVRVTRETQRRVDGGCRCLPIRPTGPVMIRIAILAVLISCIATMAGAADDLYYAQTVVTGQG